MGIFLLRKETNEEKKATSCISISCTLCRGSELHRVVGFTGLIHCMVVSGPHSSPLKIGQTSNSGITLFNIPLSGATIPKHPCRTASLEIKGLKEILTSVSFFLYPKPTGIKQKLNHWFSHN